MISLSSPHALPQSYRPAGFQLPAAKPELRFGATDEPPAHPGTKHLEIKYRQKAEQQTRKLEFALRRLGNWWFGRRYGEQIDHIYNAIKDIDEKSPQYIPTAARLARIVASFHDMEIDINTENGELKNIVDEGEACIFIMNHDDQGKDPVMLAAFAARLYQEYAKAGKEETAPHPKVILNEDILLSQGEKVRTIYEKMGAVGVDASLHGSGNADMKSGKVLLSLLKSFGQDQAHIFLFPEGRLSAYKKLDLRRKFQPGVGDIVRQAARKKSRVKVVPLGFAYGKAGKKSLGSIQIGTPVYFSFEGDRMLASLGSVTPEEASPGYRQFFFNQRQRTYNRRDFLRLLANPLQYPRINRENDVKHPPPPPQPFVAIKGAPAKAIRDNAYQPVTGKELKLYVSDVLAENLRICREKARRTCERIRREELAQ